MIDYTEKKKNIRYPRYVVMKINGFPVKFKVDTGASETVIGPELHKKLNLPKTKEVKEKIFGPCSIQLPARGVCENVEIKWQNKSKKTNIYVLQNQDTPLLGLPDCEAFSILKWHKEVNFVQQNLSVLPEKEYKQIFHGLGKMKGKYKIELKEGSTPYAIATPRNISIPLRPKVEKALQNLIDTGVIEPISHPTEWCAPLVPVVETKRKSKNQNEAIDKIRITIDYTEINKSIMREYHPLPTVEECLAQLSDAKYFSKIDALKSYFQVELYESSKDLTTFITPFGRYRFNRLPMGMKSSSEVFQRKMAMLLSGLKGCVNHVDDILVFGKTIAEHDCNLRNVLKALYEGGVTLNQEKCKFRTKECIFLGYKITGEGVQPLESKVEAIVNMPIPKDLTALRSALGAINQMLRFLPNTTDITKPLRDMLKKGANLEWGEEHNKSFEELKKMLTSAPVLAHYNQHLETRVTADASKNGVGAVLEQRHGDIWKPIHYWSSTLTPTQQRYAMIEKEACGLTMACERFAIYLLGLPKFTLRTDHKPLISILGSKPIAELPTRLQRFRMRLTPFNYNIEHIPGKLMYTADMLSRSPVPGKHEDKDILEEELIEKITCINMLKKIPVTDQRLQRIKDAQSQDTICTKLITYIMHGWPHLKDIEEEIKPFHSHRGDLILVNDIIMHKHQLYIPKAMREELLSKIHNEHVSTYRSQQRARQSIWWLTMDMEIQAWTEKCEECTKSIKQRQEPLIPGEIPEHPFEIIAADLCTYKNKEYLVVRDILSNYPEVITLKTTTSSTIIQHLKSIMARHGIPRILRTDNGPQFSSNEFVEFAKTWDFSHVTSSPHYPQSNGVAEIGVKIVKNIFESHEDPLLGLLNYRTTPTKLGLAPSQIAMSRLLNNNLPTISINLKPQVQDLETYKAKLQKRRLKSKEIYDKRHKVKELSDLPVGTKVYLQDEKIHGMIIEKRKEPRSYIVLTQKGKKLRKNRKDIVDMSKTTKKPFSTIPNTILHQPTTIPTHLINFKSYTQESLPTQSQNYLLEKDPSQTQITVQTPVEDVMSELPTCITDETETPISSLKSPQQNTEDIIIVKQTPDKVPIELGENSQTETNNLTPIPPGNTNKLTTRSGRNIKVKNKCSCDQC